MKPTYFPSHHPIHPPMEMLRIIKIFFILRSLSEQRSSLRLNHPDHSPDIFDTSSQPSISEDFSFHSLRRRNTWGKRSPAPFTIYRGNIIQHRKAKSISIEVFRRGRNAGHPAPPAQIPACATNAPGSYLGCVTQRRWFGYGCCTRG